MNESDQSVVVVVFPVTLKWGKKVFTVDDDDQQQLLSIRPNSSTDVFKEQIQSLTGVPKHRQKLLCKNGWKGMLKDNDTFNENIKLSKGQSSLIVTLIGSAESLPEKPEQKTKSAGTKFVEDLALTAANFAQEQQVLNNVDGMIQAIQKPPIERNDDNHKTGMYPYNRFVTGLPQYQIEALLRQRQKKQEQKPKKKGSESETETETEPASVALSTPSPSPLLGKVVMTMGLELRRAYINALTVLPNDGTLLSAYDDGHVMSWRHGERIFDVVHDGVGTGGVDCIVPFNTGNDQHLSFATGGRGCIRLWDNDGEECIQAFASPPGTSPNCLASFNLKANSITNNTILCLAASFKIIRQVNPNQFRLPPQDEAQRQRRAQAQAQEAAIQNELARISCKIQIWWLHNNNTTTNNNNPKLESVILSADNSAPITSLIVLNNFSMDTKHQCLVTGDKIGGLRFWQPSVVEQAIANNNNTLNAPPNNTTKVRWNQSYLIHLRPTPEESETNNQVVAASVVCMEPIEVAGSSGLLAVSTEAITTTRVDGGTSGILPGSVQLNIPTTGISIIDLDTTTIRVILDAHKDTVICMRSLPNGNGLVTGGGKYDTTLKVWDSSQLQQNCDDMETDNNDINNNSGGNNCTTLSKASNELNDVGYVFALEILPDSKLGSQHYALSAARYNVVKICL